VCVCARAYVCMWVCVCVCMAAREQVAICRESLLVLSWFTLALYGFACDIVDVMGSWRRRSLRERALYLAARSGELGEVTRLLELGVDPEGYRDPREYGATALIVAASYGHAQVVRELLDAGAHMDQPDDLLRTPLIHAVAQAQIEATHELLDAGADIEARDLYLNTYVMVCFSRFFVGFVWDVEFAGRNREMARMLMEEGADVHVEDAFGFSVLTWAWINVQLEIVLDVFIPHHPYHESMYDMLQQHVLGALSALQRPQDLRVCSSAAA